MNRFTALVVALILALLPAMALAEAPVQEINWSDIEASVAESGIEGEFWTLNAVAVQYWIPTVFQEVENEDESILVQYSTADKTATIGIQYLEGVEGASVADLAETFQADSTFAEVELCKLNGIDAVLYKLPASDAQGVCIATDSGNFVQFVFAPISDEGFHSIAQIVAASIMPEA